MDVTDSEQFSEWLEYVNCDPWLELHDDQQPQSHVTDLLTWDNPPHRSMNDARPALNTVSYYLPNVSRKPLT